MAASPYFFRSLSSVRNLDAATLCAALLHAERDTLVRLDRYAGINECPLDCAPVYLPCPKHTTWALWHAALERNEFRSTTPSARFRAIAERWEDETGEHVHPKEVRRAFRRADPTNCDCPVRVLPCAHVVERSWYLPLAAQVLLRRLLAPANVEDPLAPSPSFVMTRRAKVAVMAQRVAAHYQPLHPDDALQRDLPWGGRRLRKSAKAHAAPAAGPFMRTDGEHAA